MLSGYLKGSQVISTVLLSVKRDGDSRLESFDIPLVCVLNSSRKGVLHASSCCLQMPVKNSPSRMKALIHFLSARRAAALCPGVGGKEGDSGHSLQVSCCRDAAREENGD